MNWGEDKSPTVGCRTQRMKTQIRIFIYLYKDNKKRPTLGGVSLENQCLTQIVSSDNRIRTGDLKVMSLPSWPLLYIAATNISIIF